MLWRPAPTRGAAPWMAPHPGATSPSGLLALACRPRPKWVLLSRRVLLSTGRTLGFVHLTSRPTALHQANLSSAMQVCDENLPGHLQRVCRLLLLIAMPLYGACTQVLSSGAAARDYQDERFSYVVLARGQRPALPAAQADAPIASFLQDDPRLDAPIASRPAEEPGFPALHAPGQAWQSFITTALASFQRGCAFCHTLNSTYCSADRLYCTAGAMCGAVPAWYWQHAACPGS